MAFLTMPSLGSDMEDGTLLSWQVAPGDRVEKGSVVAIVDTDKAALDVEIFFSGVVEELLVEPGTKVPVGAKLARVRRDDEDEAAEEPGSPAPPAVESVRPAATPQAAEAMSSTRKRISPAARKRARELGVDVEALSGTGPQGAVTLADVEAAKASPPDRTVRIRSAIAAKMERANREIPHYYLHTTVDLEPALSWLEAENAGRGVAERVLPGALLLCAAAKALRKTPELNGFWVDGHFEPSEEIHLGTAIAIKGGGVLVPAIADADALSVVEMMAKLKDLVARAREHRLKPSELSDATCTVTSLGDRAPEAVFGVVFPPQVALIGFGSIVERPWVVDGAVVPRRVVTISLAADHRASDGHLGGRLLKALARLLTHPEKL